MTITTRGLQGTVSDTDMATQFPHHAPTVRTAADWAVTAVAGARSVSIAAGAADGQFMRVISDAAITQALTPPASGGKWYLVAIRRRWSPTNTATVEAIDTGATDAGTAIPATVPPAAMNAAGVLNNPGTDAGSHQVLAAVYVRASDTTLAVFDFRLRKTGAGNLLAPTLWALQFALTTDLVNVGGVVAVGQHTFVSGGKHTSSTWLRRGSGANTAVPVGTIITDDTGTATGTSVRQDILNFATAGYTNSLGFDVGVTRALDTKAGITHRFMPAVTWKPWESDWITTVPTWSGFAGAAYASPGWLPGGRYRYTSGKVRYEFGALVQSNMTPGTVLVSLPVASDRTGAFNSGTTSPLQDSFAVTGRAARFNGTRTYDYAIRWYDANTLAFSVVNSAQYMDGIGGGAWTQSEQLFGVIEYDPA